tara:strand:+ start:752 stop:901 length:150 start_codon:yes stop_codon:yes gene_type:complete
MQNLEYCLCVALGAVTFLNLYGYIQTSKLHRKIDILLDEASLLKKEGLN